METESAVEISDSDTMVDLHRDNQDQSLPTSSRRMKDFFQASDTDVLFVESIVNNVFTLHSTEDLNVADDLNVPFQSSSITSAEYVDDSNVVTIFTGDINGI